MKNFCRAAFAAFLLFLTVAAPAAALPSGQLVFKYNNYTNITTATTINITPNPALVAEFCVNSVGTTSTLVLWDSATASGNKVGTFTTTAVGCYPIDVAMLNGITVVTTGSPAADITVYWRS